jgi:hypothetical protein
MNTPYDETPAEAGLEALIAAHLGGTSTEAVDLLPGPSPLTHDTTITVTTMDAGTVATARDLRRRLNL